MTTCPECNSNEVWNNAIYARNLLTNHLVKLYLTLPSSTYKGVCGGYTISISQATTQSAYEALPLDPSNTVPNPDISFKSSPDDLLNFIEGVADFYRFPEGVVEVTSFYNVLPESLTIEAD